MAQVALGVLDVSASSGPAQDSALKHLPIGMFLISQSSL